MRFKTKYPNLDEKLPEWCRTQEDINLHMLYRQERETPRKRGIELLKDNRMCKGMAFTLYERQYFGIHGLLPPAFMTEDQQAYRVIANLRQQPDDLARYVQLDSLQVIVVTDGERILGLGDLGCYGMGIPVGKLALYVALAGVLPKWCLPVVLDVGTDNELQSLLKDPFYIGLRRKRVRGEEFGQSLVIQFEDFARQNAYRLLERYRNRYCVFNDDIQGTASVVLAGLLACHRYTGRPLSAEKIIFLGAGAAAMGIANLCIAQMEKEGIQHDIACSRIYLMDANGLITKNRLHMEKEHIPYAKTMPETKNLLELIKNIKPTALIGVSTVGGAFSEEIIRTMAKLNPKPIIFALSNPTKNAECTAEEAIRWTDLCVGMAAILFRIRHINDEVFRIAAQEVAKCVNDDDMKYRRLFPSFSRIRDVSLKIILAIGKYSYEKNLASLYPEPANMEKFVRCQMYQTTYNEMTDYTYDWPEHDMTQGYPVPYKEKHDD
uniref:Malic enzyme n=1 Tax=Setaria digitata TaxID=48799 RepID=A0A915PK80_9BILA